MTCVSDLPPVALSIIRNARPVDLIPCVGALGFFRPDFTRTYAPKPERKPRPPKAQPAPPAPDPDLFG